MLPIPKRRHTSRIGLPTWPLGIWGALFWVFLHKTGRSTRRNTAVDIMAPFLRAPRLAKRCVVPFMMSPFQYRTAALARIYTNQSRSPTHLQLQLQSVCRPLFAQKHVHTLPPWTFPMLPSPTLQAIVDTAVVLETVRGLGGLFQWCWSKPFLADCLTKSDWFMMSLLCVCLPGDCIAE